MTKPEIYIEFDLLNGSHCQIVIPRGGDYSRACFKQSRQNEFDLLPFFMERICLIDGIKKDFIYFADLMCDDYMKIVNSMTGLINQPNQ